MTPAVIPQRLRNYGLRTQLVRGGAASVGLQLAHTSLLLLVGVVLARMLGPTGYGTYAYVISIVTLLAIPAQVGLPQLVVRETAKSHSQEQWGTMRGLWRWATHVSLFSSLLLALLLGGIAWLLTDHVDRAQLVTLTWGLLLVPLIVLANLRGAALRGLGRVIQGQLPEFILRPGLLIVLVALSFSGATILSPDQAMAMHVLAATIAFLVGVWFLHRARPSPLVNARTIPVYSHRKWITSALPLAFVTGVHVINNQTDILMLGIFEGAEKVGVYRVAVQGAALVTLGLSAINMIVSPQFARLYAQADMARLQRVATASSRAVLLLALPVVITFVLLGQPILANLFGPAYLSGYGALVILAIGQLANAAFGSVAIMLNMTGHEHITARIVGSAAICNVILNLTLIPTLGVNGAALATGTTTFLLNFLLWRSLRRHLGIESMALALASPPMPRSARAL